MYSCSNRDFTYTATLNGEKAMEGKTFTRNYKPNFSSTFFTSNLNTPVYFHVPVVKIFSCSIYHKSWSFYSYFFQRIFTTVKFSWQILIKDSPELLKLMDEFKFKVEKIIILVFILRT